MKRGLPSWARSVRVRLLVIALLPMLVLLPLLLGMTVWRWSGKVDDLLTVKVNGDLTIAHQYMARLRENSGDRIEALGASVAFAEGMARPDTGTASDFLERRRRALGFDFLYVVTRSGRIIPSDTPVGADVSARDWPVVRAALDGATRSAVDVFDHEQLAALSPALAERARVPLVPTRAAKPTSRDVVEDGMVLHAAAPVRLPGGQRAALVGGRLLNRNLDFIDTINGLVYRDRSLPEGSQGTATLFLDDVRVSTNVRLFEGERALGTRVSAEVRSQVLERGEVWLDRAFVVNDWYISAYEPIVDSRGERVGMLYVGFLETPFREARIDSLLLIATIFLAIAVLSVPIFLRWARRIFRPLERMNDTIGRVEAGDLGARIGTGGGRGEISRVARHLDDLLDQVQERDRRLRDWASELNDKVAERTRDLQEANRRLERTTEQLVMSEKLAAVGEITAGVAHEINNPVAVIQGNLDVARQTLGARADEVATEFDLIDDQVHRISAIVTKLLQFARPGDFSGSANRLVPAEVIDDCLVLTRHLSSKADVTLKRDDRSTATILVERTELQQVIINLVVNAIHAMPEGGTLTLETEDREAEGMAGVAIIVTDTGRGMAPEVLKRIFDPFFTTKRAQGTGLGLSISQTLVARAGGWIEATSEEGAGSRFTVWIPAFQ
ncbi:sensor histidine kinase [Halomonas caseinilytica]|uniref:histidine kinase n=1 Tax=Halomonas caseinilytica TaxID=438744 RepID=A0A1M6W7C9_9GAMM|nr:HAMP domain-containing sensor histidine kinase [Halomonas caseinilytica]SHK89597.1 HAMP domain-containing protein [Halomonas caseinilytica]